ncbi:MAG: hypothetical protein GF405_00495 [Candidatus Eisenbacteria bacterium]|nr:hypothetical protein [Candidatus Eisenbacteria bacterium]
MQTNSYDDWMRRPLSSAVCPTEDIWPAVTRVDRVPGIARYSHGHPPNAGPARFHRGPHGAGHGRPTTREAFMKEEKLRILKMVEDGKISADEAARLIEALDKSDNKPTERDLKRRWLKVQVTKDGEQKVNLRVPLALLKFGFQFAPMAMKHGMEKKRARAERVRAKMEAKIEKAREKARVKLEKQLGPDADIDGILDGMFDGALEEELASAGINGAHVHGAIGDALGKGFDLDLDKILEMAQEEGFDGKILDVQDDEDGEHVVIRLE